MEYNYYCDTSKVVKEVLSYLNSRLKDIIQKRFGLLTGEPLTLESIGKEYKITRERVRQLEASGLKRIKETKENIQLLLDFFDKVKKYLEYFGGVRQENSLLSDFSKTVINRKKKIVNCEIKFLLSLDNNFIYHNETEELFAAWSLDEEIYFLIKQKINNFIKNLESKKKLFDFEQLINEWRNILGNLVKDRNEEVLISWLNLSKIIASNPYGEYGLIFWPEIHPQNIRDKAYLVVKKEKTPLHFFQISRLIEKIFSFGRPVNCQTVHNELIKDHRFVLVGRGIYALREWGFEPGTVRDIITSILKKYQRPMTKNEIIEAVSRQRQVKELTIIFNLQNRKFFKRLADGRYTLNKELIIEET